MTETPAPAKPATSPPHPARPAPTPAKAAPAGAAPPTSRRRPEPRPDRSDTKVVHWILLGAIVVLAIGLRAKEPLSSPLIGAEDPYRHMERTWDLVQGKGFAEYPPGLNLVLLPFTFLGPDAFYTVSMYIPLAFGAAMVVGMFMLARYALHPSGALVAAALVAVMPETIQRTNLLFPTAMDLALVPFLFLAILKVADGNRRAIVPAGILGGFLLISHPWVIALLAPPLAVMGFILAWRRPALRSKALAAAGGAAALAVVGVILLRDMVLGHALPRLIELITNPASATPLPAYVDLPAMLTVPALLLAGVGVVLAFRRRDAYSILALLWTGMLLPLALVDWFGMWYVPHRTIAYIGIGIAMLGALPVAELLRLLKDSRPQAQPSATFGALALAILVVSPTGFNVEPWYRTFTEDELDAWHELGDRGTPYILAGSWQARAGYRAVTSLEANYYPDFFSDPFVRQLEERNHPGLVVLIDCHTSVAGHPTDFLAAEGWRQVGEWGDRSCPDGMGWTAAYQK